MPPSTKKSPPKKKPRTSPRPSGRPTRGPSKKRQTFVFVEGTGRAIRPENKKKTAKRSQPKKK